MRLTDANGLEICFRCGVEAVAGRLPASARLQIVLQFCRDAASSALPADERSLEAHGL